MFETPLISIVDDDALARDGIRELVESLGYDVVTFTSAKHFLQSDVIADRYRGLECWMGWRRQGVGKPDIGGKTLENTMLFVECAKQLGMTGHTFGGTEEQNAIRIKGIIKFFRMRSCKSLNPKQIAACGRINGQHRVKRPGLQLCAAASEWPLIAHWCTERRAVPLANYGQLSTSRRAPPTRL